MKRHISGLAFSLCIGMQLCALPYTDRLGKDFHHSNQDGDIPVIYPGWKDDKLKAAQPAPAYATKPTKAKAPAVQPSILPDLPDDAADQSGERAHIVFTKGSEKDPNATKLIIDLEPQETEALVKGLSPAVKVAGVVLGAAGVAGVCIAAVCYGPAIKVWWNRK